MTIDSAFYDHLRLDSGIAALVATRVFPEIAPQDAALPRIVYTAVSGEHERHMEAGAGLASVSMQIDVYAATTASRRAVVDALFDRLHGFAGAMGAESFDVRSVEFVGPANSYDPPSDGSEIGVFRGRCSAEIWHGEAVPVFT